MKFYLDPYSQTSLEAVENTHWSQELLCKRSYLEYTDMKVLSLAALVKLSGTKKTWDTIFLKPILCWGVSLFWKPVKLIACL